jgi:CRISPR-associated protein Cas2
VNTRCYLVTYDISDPKRWKRVYQVMKSFGEHVQLSVFRCDLEPMQAVRLKGHLEEIIKHDEDQVILVDLGPSSPAVIGEIEVLGRPKTFHVPGPVIA